MCTPCLQTAGQPGSDGKRTFVEFILEPIYKVFSHVLGEPDKVISQVLAEFGAALRPSAFGNDVKPLLKEAWLSIVGPASGLVDMMVKHFPSSRVGNANKVSALARILGSRSGSSLGRLRIC